MPKPTLLQRDNFKTYLRYYKDKFSNTTIPFFYLDNIVTSVSSGISTTDNVKVLVFDNFEEVDITSIVNNNNLFYIPALSGDTITLGVGTSAYTLKYIDENSGIQYNGTTYGLGDSIPLTNKNLIVKGLGGGLLQPSDPPVYTLGVSTTTTSEGGSVVFTINTINVGAGATLYYSTSGSVSASDFSNNSLTGSFAIVGVGSTTGIATVTRTIANDFVAEGTETFQFVVRTGSTSGTIVATSSTISVANVTQTYSLTSSSTTVNEGSSVTFTLTTIGVPNGTTFYYTTTGNVTGVDFTDNSLTGSFSVTNNTGSFTRTIKSDRFTEGLEQFQVQVRTTSTSGTVVATSEIININDSSVNVGQNANGLTFGPVQVNRDNGNTANASDWYTICGIDNLPEGSKIALFIDTSGSMTQDTIQASYNLLLSKLAAKNISIITVTNGNEDWITPFLTDLS